MKYTREEIKEKFQNYRDQGGLLLVDDEYDFFCGAICLLEKDIVDRIHKEIYFIALSAEEKEVNKKYTACYVNLSSKDLLKKEAIILLCPILFDILDKKEQYRMIFHEIAHHVLDHKDFKNSEEKKKADIKADEKAISWLEGVGIPWP